LWALEIASRIVDMVFYASVPTNEQIVLEQKKRFGNGIVVPREDIESYIDEAGAILIGPGMIRATPEEVSSVSLHPSSLVDIFAISHEGIQTYFLTEYLLKKYPHKKWVIDAGALQMLRPEWLLGLKTTPILTPHQQEFERAFQMTPTSEHVAHMAREYKAVLLVKEHEDVVCSPEKCVKVAGGNAGMTKGGTGDVLAGLTAGLYSQNDDPVLVAQASSYINKKAGESLFDKVGYYFNATDLADEIPKVMKKLIVPDAL
jgi:NAD(P)H-hydrate epimerase